MIEGEKEKGVQDLGVCTPFYSNFLANSIFYSLAPNKNA